MPKRIVFTRHDGEVAVCAPSLTAMAYMTGGGGRWDGFPPGFLDRQIAEQAKYGVGEWAAVRFVRAMQLGGLSSAEAYAVARDRFCGHLGTGHELWDTPTFQPIAGLAVPGCADTTVGRSTFR